jgi:hypothetical protein
MSFWTDVVSGFLSGLSSASSRMANHWRTERPEVARKWDAVHGSTRQLQLRVMEAVKAQSKKEGV